MSSPSGPRIGFACVWDQPGPMGTWSHTPWNLREAMRRHADVVDVGVDIPRRAQVALKALHARRRGGRMVTTWQQSRLTDAYVERAVRRAATAAACDAVVQMGDMAVTDQPFFLYQDFSFDALLRAHQENGVELPFGLSRSDLLRRRERQHRVYAKAAGIIAMSHWFARSLIELSGLPPAKVHVVQPGRSAVVAGRGAVPPRERPRRRLLLVGKGLHGKGADLVLGALAILRREADPAITLTVVGPPRWPLPGPVPGGVTFLGALPVAEVAALYDTHDLFVMPSRLEGFGIVFVEALARGLPCVGRDAYAMSEIIEPGTSGALIKGDDPAELAAVIADVLNDDALYAACRAASAQTASWFTWERAGRAAVEAIAVTLGSPLRPA